MTPSFRSSPIPSQGPVQAHGQRDQRHHHRGLVAAAGRERLQQLGPAEPVQRRPRRGAVVGFEQRRPGARGHRQRRHGGSLQQHQRPLTRVGPVNVAPLDAARSSRAPKLATGGDFQGLNFVAYAEDAVTDLYWTEVQRRQAPTPQRASLPIGGNPTKAELTSIWNETYTGGVPRQDLVRCIRHQRRCVQQQPDLRLLVAERFGHRVDVGVRHRRDVPGHGVQLAGDARSSSRTRRPRSWTTTRPPGGRRDVLLLVRQVQQGLRAARGNGELNAAGSAQARRRCCWWSGQQGHAGHRRSGHHARAKSSINAQLPGLVETPRTSVTACCTTCTRTGSNPDLPASLAGDAERHQRGRLPVQAVDGTDIDPNTGSTYQAEIEQRSSSQGFFPLPACWSRTARMTPPPDGA